MDEIKTVLVKDGVLIIHFGRKGIPMSRFVTMDKSLAKDFLTAIRGFLNE